MANRNNVLYGRIAVDLHLLAVDVVKPVLDSHLNASENTFEKALLEASYLTEPDSARIRAELARLLDQHDGDAARALEALDNNTPLDDDPAASYLMPTEHGSPGSWQELSEEVNVDVGNDDARYTDPTEHARGGMGRILLVQDTRMNRAVALKELIPATDACDATLVGADTARESSHLVQRFLREARITGGLEHPSIVPVYELGRRADGSHYYTMKFVKGRSLYHAIHEATGLADRLKLLPHVINLCQAIAYAHDKGVIHRDIKPSNVMVGSFGETVVIDWGLARVLNQKDPYASDLQSFATVQLEGERQDATQTIAGLPVGTPHYMPPEQAEGRMDEVNARSDVYSLGVVLYELLTGTTPYTGSNSRIVLQKVRTVKPPSVLARDASIPPALAAICAKAMARVPAERHASAGELADELTRFTTGALVHGYEYSFWELLRRYYYRNKALCNTAIAAALVTLTIAATAYVYILEANHREREQRIAAESARHLAESSAYRAGIQLASNHIADQHFKQASAVLLEQPASLRNWEWGLLFEQCNQDYATTTDHLGDVINILPAPNNQLISVGFSERLVLRSCPDLTSVYEVDLAGLPGTIAAISPDGGLLAVAHMDGTLQIHDVTGQRSIQTLEFPGTEFGGTAFSGDGSLLALGSRNGSVYILQSSTGALLHHIQGNGAARNVMGMSADGTLVVASDHSGKTVVWDIPTESSKYELPAEVFSIAADSRSIPIFNGSTVQVYDIASGKLRFQSEALPGSTRPPKINADGRTVAAMVKDGLARIWDVETGLMQMEIQDEAAVAVLALSPDGELIAVATRPNSVQLRRSRDGAVVQTLDGHSNPVRVGFFSDDSNMFYSCAGDPEVKAWQVSERERDVQSTPLEDVYSIGVSSEDDVIALGSMRGVVAFAEAKSMAPTMAMASFEPVSDVHVAFAHEGGRAGLTLDTRTVFAIRLSDYAVVSHWGSSVGRISTIGVSPDGNAIAVTDSATTVPVIDFETGTELLRFSEHQNPVTALAFGPTGHRIVTGDRAGRLLLWNWRTGKIIQELQAGGSAALGVAYSGDGQQIAVSFEDAPAAIFQPDTDRSPRYLSGPESAIRQITFSDDGRRVLGLPRGKALAIWDTETGQLLSTSRYWRSPVSGFALDPNHDRVLIESRERGFTAFTAFPARLSATDLVDPTVVSAYKRARGKANSFVAPNTLHYIAFTPPRIVDEAVARLQQQPPGSPEGGYVEPANNPLARLGIETEDVIALVDGQSCTGPALLQERLGKFARSDEGKSLVLAVTRGTRVLTIEHRLFMSVRTEKTLVYDKNDALQLLRGSLDFFRKFQRQFVDSSQRSENARGAGLHGEDALNGFWVPTPTTEQDEQGLAAMGLAEGDCVLSVSGIQVTSYRDLVSWLERAIQALEAGKTGAIPLQVQQGRYSTMDLTWSVE